MYCKVTDGSAVEYTLRDIKRDYPRVSLPAVIGPNVLTRLAEEGIYPVTEVAQPPVDASTQKITGFTIEGSGSAWTQSWIVETKTQEEQAAYQKDQDYVADRDALKVDAQVRQLLKARPRQLNNYIENNVTDLASAKTILKIYGRALAVLARTVMD